jgi:hypothetical protein
VALLTTILATGALWQQVTAAQTSAPSPLEYQVKAAYIFNFVTLTEWPAAALGSAGEPFRICVTANDAFSRSLESTVKGENVQGHPLVMERLGRGDTGEQCRVVFISAGTAERSAEWLRTLAALPVLTIGESESFLRSGGLVAFVVDQGHVRFDVNRQLAEQRGLRFSSRLLRVARNVK